MILIDDINKLYDCADHLFFYGGPVFFDTETTGLDPYTNTLTLLQLYFDDTSYIVDCSKFNRAQLQVLAERLIRTKDEGPIVAHNMTFDWQQVYHHLGVAMPRVYCTMIAEQVLKAGISDYGFSLADVTYRRIGVELDKTVRDKFISGEKLSEDMLVYASRDTEVLKEIYSQQLKEIKQEKQERVIELECGNIPITARMEYNGICVDRERMESAIPPINNLIDRSFQAIQNTVIRNGLADGILFCRDGIIAVNPNSQPQMLSIVNGMGIDVETLDKKDLTSWDGNWALSNKDKVVDDMFIEDEFNEGDEELHLGYAHPFLKLYSVFKAANKIRGTYLLGILEKINPVTGKIHPRFSQCGAVATGRRSSSNPNFQNMPNKDKLTNLGLGNYDIRSMFVAPKGSKFIISDYSGIELVILAAWSGDENLREQIMHGDIHSFVGNSLEREKIIDIVGDLLNKETKEIMPGKLIRNEFKRVSYGVVYGSTGFNLYKTCALPLYTVGMQITRNDADRWVNDWLTRLFPKTGQFLDSNARKAITQYYTESVIGRRRRWTPDIRLSKKRLFAAQREGKNQPIQSSSADMTKLAEYIVDSRLDSRYAHIVAVVHDEIIVEARDEYVEEAAKITGEGMEEAGYTLFPDLPIGMIKASPKISTRYDK